MKKVNTVNDKDFAKMEKVYTDRKKYVVNNGHFYLSYGIRIFLMFLSIMVLAAVSYVCFAVSFSDGKTIYMNYKKSANVEHDVTLIENNLYDQGIIQAVDSYLSDELDKVSTDISYMLSLDEKSDIQYTYWVDIVREVKNSKNGEYISNRIDTLIKEQTGVVEDSKVLDLHQNVNLDYFSYNNDVKKLLTEEQLEVNSNLFLKMYVELEVTNNKIEKTFRTKDVIDIKIPLMSTNVTVSMVDSINEENVYLEHTDSELVNEASLFVGIILLILDTIFVLITISFIAKSTPKKSKYVKLRDGLLRSYGNVIVITKNIPEFDGYNVISCYSFSELMDAQKLLKKPVLYQEIVKDQKCMFVVVSDSDLYQFVLKEADIEF